MKKQHHPRPGDVYVDKGYSDEQKRLYVVTDYELPAGINVKLCAIYDYDSHEFIELAPVSISTRVSVYTTVFSVVQRRIQ